MVVLGLVYAVVEEAFVTQSQFNPDYLGLRLLDYGYVSGLGISVWWTVFVLGIHTIWSTAVPIALVESLTPERRHAPWLGPWDSQRQRSSSWPAVRCCSSSSNRTPSWPRGRSWSAARSSSWC